MAGLGRRTHYRKHLTDSVLYDLPEPKDNERIAKVVATRGGNQFDIVLASPPGSDVGSARAGLAILPTRFHKLVWVKRNDYVIVQTGIEADDGEPPENTGHGGETTAPASGETSETANPSETGIRFIIAHILYKDQVKHLVAKGFWPENDPEFPGGGGEAPTDPCGGGTGPDGSGGDPCDGIVYADQYYDSDGDDDLFVNTNRIARLEIRDSDSEEDSSDEDGDE
ncbi:unnamed protein product [Pseudo-nitzschia multistriata]|uniref:S1-like domain-containing protein n=1 Tax=Pseudo-nitzschia multistriata TaxID=183589 RepID=A0A448ZTM0_9STRA|nr:unnamed protein product [Pseudo-nitzschia multistriata]